MSNVLGNAVKWSPPGGTIDVRVAGATVIVVGHREQVRAIGDHVVEVVPEVRYAPV